MKISSAQFAGSSTTIAGRPHARLPEFAFIGRSNVGKSSLINMLCGNSRLAMTSSKPGKTRVVNHFLINNSWYLVDLPGYGYAKGGNAVREGIKDVISDYITQSPDLTMLFVLIDSRFDITAIDLGFLAELAYHRIPFAIILTKADKQGPNVLKARMESDRRILSEQWDPLPDMLSSSSVNGSGRDEILSYIENVLNTI